MKLLPSIQLPQLPPVSAGGGVTGMESRLPPGISLPFSPTELLWRYSPAMNFPPSHPSPSPFLDFKTHLPTSLGESSSIKAQRPATMHLPRKLIIMVMRVIKKDYMLNSFGSKIVVPRGCGDVSAMGRAGIRLAEIRHGHVPNEWQSALPVDKSRSGRKMPRRWRRVAQCALDAC